MNERINPSRFDSRHFILSELHQHVVQFADGYLKGHNAVVVDLGCGDMPYRELLLPWAKEYIGVDLPGSRADHFFGPDGRTSLGSESADVVISTQVLEHVDSPSAFLEECLRLLKPGGVLLLTTHGQWPYHPNPADYWRWTCDGLRRTVEAPGFRIESFRGAMSLLGTSIQFFQDACLLNLPIPRVLWKPFAFTMQLLVGFAEFLVSSSQTASRHRDRDASVFILIARRPMAFEERKGDSF